ncbi:hypothetical protein OCH239_20525 [Roseivivax halodurans JCM 10272]|uniref:ParB/Sulfiredoxin domain-containing protein n=1 Tax=Roseivivax halodurans JCM 10272 TaxID=1449350 RepID=X7EHS5_9RHOB|nr:hypothetical protein [Roseivivax halodurans]ETX14751.1 hypothetical protein OCH239_20525 [Roseivivax halodurans JCM 10272]
MNDESISARPRLLRMIEAGVPVKALRDLGNRIRFGPNAPRSDELIWIDPMQVTHVYSRKGPVAYRRRHSGIVAGGDWDRRGTPIDDATKVSACNRHFVDGESWEETGIVEEMMSRIDRCGIFDGCRTREDVLARYERIDRMYDEVARTRRLEPMMDRPERFRREHGGILIHIDHDGRPLLAGNGNHRLAIGRILKLDRVPAQLGAIHIDAWSAGIMPLLRQETSRAT